MQHVWDEYITDRDRAVFDRAGYGTVSAGSGPTAVCVIDMTIAFLGDEPLPVLESTKRFPNSCGEEGWAVAERLAGFLGAAREAAVPIVYTVKDLDHQDLAARAWQRTQREVAHPQTDFATVVPLVAPQPGDVVVRKTKPSAFFATPLLQQLLAWGVRRLVCCGATSSGCVRATVVDAFSHGFEVVVPSDGVCDRGQASHAVSLFDMAQKYAAVMDLVAVQQVLTAERTTDA